MYILRYITRAVLIPFSKSSSASSLSPSKKVKLDLELSKSMEKASKGVGTIIKLGRQIDDDKMMDTIMEKLQDMLGSKQKIIPILFFADS